MIIPYHLDHTHHTNSKPVANKLSHFKAVSLPEF